MYCPSCGTELTQELSYCQRCGANLSVSKARGDSKSTAKLLESIVQISVLLPGVMLVGMVLLKFNEFHQWLIVLFMLLVFLMWMGLDSLLLWHFLHLNSRAHKEGVAPQLERLDTKELDARKEQAFLKPTNSVTESTTRLFEPAFRERHDDR